jgi:16S rRNA (cytidine1402-2'-O)-methyltransferase
MLAALLETCTVSTRLCVAADLTLPTESIATLTVGEWKKAPLQIGKRPAVFLLLSQRR